MPLSSQVLNLHVDTELFTKVYERLPEALRTPQSYALLEQALSGQRLIALGTSFIGRSAKLVAQLTGSNHTWSYHCRVWISLLPDEHPAGPVSLTKASMGTAHKAAGSLADSTTLATGPTFSATGTAGTLMGLQQIGGSATVGVTYKREKASNHTSNLGHERSDNLSYGEGALHYGNHATVRIRVEWNKQRNPLAVWARGKPHKEHTISPQGTGHSVAAAELEYVIPRALVPPKGIDVGTSTSPWTVSRVWEV
ncbi:MULTISPECIES: hypothetical protein [unclassified Streptomyces]|uniref:hypothetical protein n=1 Tax=unclassified Streptomyces TaxID=2593676 RepID=UPI0037FF5349